MTMLVYQQFLELLRCGLYTKSPDLSLFESVNWEGLFVLSKEQTVVGVISDGIELLPAELQPPRLLRLKWVMLVRQIELLNEKLDSRVKEICDVFTVMGLDPMVIKGQVISRLYPRPGHRQAGDIDLFFGNSHDADAANVWARNNARCHSEVNEKELAYTWNGVIVENHIRLADMQYRRYQDRLQEIIRHELINGDERFVDIAGARVKTLPAALTILHLIIHIQYHLLNEGLGWRQMCDLALALYNDELNQSLDRDVFKTYLADIGLTRMAGAIGCVLSETLGLATDEIPFDVSPFGADIIVNDIWTGGNFGKKRFAFKADAGFMRQKIMALPLHWQQYMKYRSLLPNEAKANFLMKFKRAAKGIK